MLIAQAALETGWGKAVTRHDDGSSSYNLFNIKADRRWDGPSVTKQTLEYRNGIAGREQAQFRAYDSFADSFNDYVDFITRQPRYQQALQHGGDAATFADELQRAGYATDPAYARKIKRIMDGPFMQSALANFTPTS